MKERLTDSFNLEGIFAKVGIPLHDREGNLRNSIDIIEDLYLLNPINLTKLFYAIGEEERFGNNIFQEARSEN